MCGLEGEWWKSSPGRSEDEESHEYFKRRFVASDGVEWTKFDGARGGLREFQAV